MARMFRPDRGPETKSSDRLKPGVAEDDTPLLGQPRRRQRSVILRKRLITRALVYVEADMILPTASGESHA